MAIGDSITQGGRYGRPEYTYRLPLQRMLGACGVAFDFIGSRSAGLDPVPWPQPFDPDHEGYYGKRTAEVLGYLRSTVPRLPPADIALIHLGSNDREWNIRDRVITPLEEIIQLLRLRNRHVAIFVMNPYDGTVSRWLRHFALRNLAKQLGTAEAPVVYIPSPSDWDWRRDNLDGTHPNEIGQGKMARSFLQAMVPWLRSRLPATAQCLVTKVAG